MPLINAELERNLRLFPSYKAATSVLPWLPIFFLYFLERVSLGDVVMLGSAYYFAVFVLEVPSGYCSDRYGRRPILIFASIVTVVACALFAAANSFAVLFIASILLATRTAFQSGSDSALLYDSLYALGREKEYTEFETNAQKWSMTTLGCSCLLGGGLGMVDMRLTYLVGFLAALVAVVLCVKFVEPPMETGERTSGFVTQMKQIVSYFTQPFLAWVLVFYIVGYSLEHIPYEFYQPYIKLLSETDASQWLPNQSAPIISSVVISISMFGGAFGAAVSQRILGRVGVRVLLLASILIQIIIIGGMSLILHPIILILVMFRNFSMSMAHGPMLGAIAPHVPSAQRATLLSVLSLGGRAAFSIVLTSLSVFVIGNNALNEPVLSSILSSSAAFGIIALLLLIVWSHRIAHQFKADQIHQRMS